MMKAIHAKLDSQLRMKLVRISREQKTAVLVYGRSGGRELAQFLQSHALREGLWFTRLPLSGYWLVRATARQIMEMAACPGVQEILPCPIRPAATDAHRREAA